MKMFVLHPGICTSKTDNNEHYITCGQLLKLYKDTIKGNRWVVYTTENDLDRFNKDELVHLFPKFDGRY